MDHAVDQKSRFGSLGIVGRRGDGKHATAQAKRPNIVMLMTPVPGVQGYLNLKLYEEFDSLDRPKGWNAWATLAFSPAATAPPTAPKRPMFTK
jgi:hypothetical protein